MSHKFSLNILRIIVFLCFIILQKEIFAFNKDLNSITEISKETCSGTCSELKRSCRCEELNDDLECEPEEGSLKDSDKDNNKDFDFSDNKEEQTTEPEFFDKNLDLSFDFFEEHLEQIMKQEYFSGEYTCGQFFSEYEIFCIFKKYMKVLSESKFSKIENWRSDEDQTSEILNKNSEVLNKENLDKNSKIKDEKFGLSDIEDLINVEDNFENHKRVKDFFYVQKVINRDNFKFIKKADIHGDIASVYAFF